MITLRRLLPSLLCILLCQAAAASRVDSALAYFISENNKEVLIPPTHERFESERGTLKLGWQTGTVWIRVPLNSLGQSNWREAPHVLRIGSYYLTEIDLYELVAGQWRRTVAGAGVSRGEANPCYDGQHCFRIDQSASDVVYLRIRAATVLTVTLDLVDLQKAMSDSALRLTRLAVHITIAACILFAAILFAVFERSALSLSFLFFQLTVFLALAGANGFLIRWFPPIGSPDSWIALIHLLFISRVAAIATLIHAVLTHYEDRAVALKLLKGIVLVHIVFGLITLSGPSAVVSALSYASLHTVFPLAVWGVVTTKDIPKNIKRLSIAGLTFGSVLLIFASLSLTNLGPFEGFDVLFVGFADQKFNGIFVGLFVLWFTLTERARKKREAHEHTEELRFRLRLAREHESVTKERGMLIDMLTHEIKNPLGTIRFASTALHSRAIESVEQKEDLSHYYRLTSSIGRIEGLLDQVALHNRLHHPDTWWERVPLNVGELLTEIKDGLDDVERLELQVPDGLVHLLNKQLFLIAMENLILNAQKYGDPESIIKLQVEAVPRTMIFQGDAAGKPPPSAGFNISIVNRLVQGSHPDTKEMFKPYYRHVSVRHHGGMGLGLSLVKTAIEKLGGSIGATIEGETICFQIHIA